MKKNMKRIIPVLATATILMGTGVLANNILTSENSSNEVQIQKVAIENPKENSIYINEKEMENVSLIKVNDKLLFPARQVFEALGYEVGYDVNTKVVTINKGAQFITFSSTSDAYTFAKMAPQPLGQAPIVKEGVTYVPVTLLTDIINMDGVSFPNENSLVILVNNDEELEASKIKTADIIDINEKNNTITIIDKERGEVVLNVKDLKVEFTTEDKELMVGQTVEVEYGDIMTSSEPPMNTPKSLKVVDKVSIVEVLSVEKDDKGNLSVLVKDSEIGEVMLNVSKELKITSQTEEKELKKGQTLEVVMGKAMTMSIPPMTNPKSINIIEKLEDKEEKLTGKATITNVDKENNRVTVNDENMGEVILNINDDVHIEYKNGDKELKNGQILDLEYSPIMTRSLPPVNNPIKIIVLN